MTDLTNITQNFLRMVSENLTACAAAKNMSTNDIAAATGLSYNTVRAALAGNSGNIVTFVKVAHVLDSDLFTTVQPVIEEVLTTLEEQEGSVDATDSFLEEGVLPDQQEVEQETQGDNLESARESNFSI